MCETKTETPQTGYACRHFPFPTKRYVQTMDLKKDPGLIAEYIKCHSETYHWPVIRQGIKEVGILEMEIYILENRLFMIVETPLDFEWETAMKKLAEHPQQTEWEEYVSLFQKIANPTNHKGKWQLMEKMFFLYD